MIPLATEIDMTQAHQIEATSPDGLQKAMIYVHLLGSNNTIQQAIAGLSSLFN